eukprot:6213320-Pleurochrysis_carterae.AAC.3
MLTCPCSPTQAQLHANIANVNERNEWYRVHYAEIDGLFDPAGLRLVQCPPDLTMVLQLRTLHKIKADGRKKARCVLQGHRLQQGRDFERTFSTTFKHTTLRTVLAISVERDLDVQGGGATQAYPQADWSTDQKVFASLTSLKAAKGGTRTA